jgi:lipopolysaccharide transport system ATP-binding protein
MKEDVLISVEGISKKFCKDLRTSLRYGLQDAAGELLGRTRTPDLRAKEFWAVQDISFELRRGECLGLIGHNGAGKTTLLRMLNGLIKPDRGRIEVRGQVGALIALGAGFNPILTGRENIYINASVLGLSKQLVDERIGEIIDFAELAEFIDMPVQHYSSGMTVRLGFAVAAILIEPDILFLDEVLAVGDISFTIKCLNRVRQLMRRSAVVFVSHSMPLVSSFCTRVLVMDHGRTVVDTPEPGVAVNHYYGLARNSSVVSGTGGASVLSSSLLVGSQPVNGDNPSVQQGVEAEVQLRLEVHPGHEALLNVFVDDATLTQLLGVPVLGQDGEPLRLGAGIHEVRVPLGRMEFNAGMYSLLVSLVDAKDRRSLCRHQGLSPFRVVADRVYWAKFIRARIAVVEHLPPVPQPVGRRGIESFNS